MRILGTVVALLTLACAPAFRPDLPTAKVPLVVVGVADRMEPEPIIGSSLAVGRLDSWWNVRITVDSVVQGNPGHARRMDYGELPAWMAPPLPFKVGKNQVLVQLSSRWKTADFALGERHTFYLWKCYNCVELPGRTAHRFYASPWFVVRVD